MGHRCNYIGATLVVLIVTFRYAAISSALGRNSNVTDRDEGKPGIFHNSTLRNASLEDCDTLAATNSSTVGENFTSDVSEGNYHRAVGTSSITICLGVWSVVANSLPLVAIIKQEQLHKPVYILMGNLAASDVLTGVAFVVYGSYVLYAIHNDTSFPPFVVRLRFTSISLSGLSSAYSLMALTAERYWFIVHGMTYINSVTNDKCKVAIMVVWLWSGLLAVLPIFGWHCTGSSDDGCIQIGGGVPYSYVVVLLVFVFIPMATILLLNFLVFWCLWKHVNAIHAQEAAVGAPPSASWKAAFTIVVITIMFFVGWLPIFTRLALHTADIASVRTTPMYSGIFIILNSAINPVIYGFRLGEVRRSVARLFHSNNGNAIFPVN